MRVAAIKKSSGPENYSISPLIVASNLKSPSIQMASTSDELDAIYHFRYRIYVEETTLPQYYVNHINRIIQDPFDHGAYNFAAFEDEEVVGMLRVNFPRTSKVSYYEDFLNLKSAGSFHPSATSICTRLMVAPRLRGTSLALR